MSAHLPEDPQQLIADMATRADQMYARAQRQQAELAALAARVERGPVTLGVVPGGSVSEVTFDGAGKETPARLTAAFDAAYRVAVRAVGEATASRSGGLDDRIRALQPPPDTADDRPAATPVELSEFDAPDQPDSAAELPEDAGFEAALAKFDISAAGLEEFLNDPLVRDTIPEGDPHSWQEQLTNEVAAISAQADTIQELMTATTGEAESKALRVTVSVGGGIQELVFRPAATSMSDAQLAAEVHAVLQEATSHAGKALHEALAEHGVDTSDSPGLSVFRPQQTDDQKNPS